MNFPIQSAVFNINLLSIDGPPSVFDSSQYKKAMTASLNKTSVQPRWMGRIDSAQQLDKTNWISIYIELAFNV